ncbi:MAG: hypothetical protein AAGA02_17005 [Bacteroidota bacterium]
MLDYLSNHLLYIPFIALNIWVIYKVIKIFVYQKDDDDKNDDDDDNGGIDLTGPELDLPPGVSLPTEPKEVVLH